MWDALGLRLVEEGAAGVSGREGVQRNETRLTLEIDVRGPVALDVWDCALATTVQAGIVAGADACGGRVEVEEACGERREVGVAVGFRAV